MYVHQRSSMLLSLIPTLLVLAVLFTACGGASSDNTSTAAKPLQNVSIGLGYTPDIQFSPFYVAKSKGYYKDAGLNVTFNHGIETDLIGTMLLGKSTFVFDSGDEQLVALDKHKDARTVDVASVYQKYPVSLIVPSGSPIKTLADLKGHSVGVPGPYGATYTGLLALLYSTHLAVKDINLQSVGFNQVAALSAHRVDAVMGYSNNEPLQLKQKGFDVRTFDVSDYQPLVSNGIVTTEKTYQDQLPMVKNFVQATLKGVQDVINDPAGAVTISKSYIPGLNATQALSVLQATLPIYKGDGHLGYNDSATWNSMAQFLVAQKIIAPISGDLTQDYTNQTLP